MKQPSRGEDDEAGREKLDQGDLTIRNVPLYVHRSEPGIKNAL